jgi:hypothetical protein
MEKAYALRGVLATEAFLRRFVDGRNKHERFSLIAAEIHEMRNVMAHQIYSSQTHNIAFDHTTAYGWRRVGSELRINPRIYADRFAAALDGGKFWNWRKWTTRLQLTKQKYRFIVKWLGLPASDLLRENVDRLLDAPNLSALRKIERSVRKEFSVRYGV